VLVPRRSHEPHRRWLAGCCWLWLGASALAWAAPESAAPQSAAPGPGGAQEPRPVEFPEGTFEELDDNGLPSGWELPNRQQVNLMEEDGNHFLRLANDKPGETVWAEYPFVLNPRWQRVLVRARLRASHLQRPANARTWETARLGLVFERVAGQRFGDFPPASPDVFHDCVWTERECVVPVPAGAKALRLTPILQNTTGTLDIDDIEIVGNPPPKSRPLRPGFPEGSFEQLDDAGAPQGWPLETEPHAQLVEEDGNHFLRLTNDDPKQFVILNSRFALPAGTTRVTIKVKLRGTHLRAGDQGYENGRLGFTFEDENGIRVGPWPMTPALKQDSAAWVSQSITTAVPADARYLVLSPVMQGTTGTLDLDDISVVTDPPVGGAGAHP